ncbi:MAG: RNA methyltransferase [Elusimicrobiota bacterium]|jgi:TrmH family RNA methyltransferase|nr:RNA methyltransferase [Elusimicrobiota bacterium]
MVITSIHNNFIKEICGLKEKKEQALTGLFLVEGKKIIDEVKNDWKIKYIFISENFKDNVDLFSSLHHCGIEPQYRADARVCPYPYGNRSIPMTTKEARNDGKKTCNSGRKAGYDAEIITVSDKVIKKLSSAQNPQGIVAVVEKKKFVIDDILKNGKNFIVLENISDPGNLGTLIRCADAFDMSAVFISKTSANLYSDKTIRASMGSIFNVPAIDEIDIDELFGRLKKANAATFASSLKAKTSLTKLKLIEKSAFFIGSEADGLRKETIVKCDFEFKIDMTGKAQSLNAAIAGAIVMYELQKRSL